MASQMLGINTDVSNETIGTFCCYLHFELVLVQDNVLEQ